MLTCYDDATLVARSLRLKKMVESSLHARNIQMSFPLYPVHSPEADIYSRVTDNQGYLTYLARNMHHANDEKKKSVGGAHHKQRTLSDFGLEAGLPYELAMIGPVLQLSQNKIHPRRRVEVRSVHYTRNPIFFHNSCYSPCDREARKMFTALADVIYTPIVSEMTWKKLSVALAKQCPPSRNGTMSAPTRDSVIDGLWTANETLNGDVRSWLAASGNEDVRGHFVELRRSLSNTSNPAYIEAMIYAVLSIMSSREWVPLFPRVYDTARGQDDSMCLPGDPYMAPIWTQYILTQHTESYYADVLAMQCEVDAERLMAHLFQLSLIHI